jgi:hypothetical protein
VQAGLGLELQQKPLMVVWELELQRGPLVVVVRELTLQQKSSAYHNACKLVSLS